MKHENLTIDEYMSQKKLEIGGLMYSYALGVLTKYKLLKIVKSEYSSDEYALLKPIACMTYEKGKWDILHGYEHENTWLRANIQYDTRFSVNEIACLKAAMQSLESHIKSSKWQFDKAEHILKNIKS